MTSITSEEVNYLILRYLQEAGMFGGWWSVRFIMLGGRLCALGLCLWPRKLCGEDRREGGRSAARHAGQLAATRASLCCY